jgi:murein L,D-transpeptidase YcbB/YkuD
MPLAARVRPAASGKGASVSRLRRLVLGLGLWVATGLAGAAVAETAAGDAVFREALTEAAAQDEAVQGFYRDRDYHTIWTGAGDAGRRSALLSVLSMAPDHGLPVARYDAAALAAAFRSATTERDRGRLEVAMSQAFLAYARDVRSGVLEPGEVDRGILREPVRTDPRLLLEELAAADPVAYLRALPPASPVYAALMHGKLTLEAQIAAGGWGPAVTPAELVPGERGPRVVALRDRLVAMGYLRPTAAALYDAQLQAAVRAFQIDHGLPADGRAGEATLVELNVAPEQRLRSVIVAMERVRWMPDDPGARHVWVNLPDFTASIVDHGRVTFSTRAVVGKDQSDQRTPEFSDEIEYMVINPSWNVPRSITTKEYLPLLKRNRNAAGHLKILDRNGRVVSRAAINFASYSARNFPYSMMQPPSEGNALGKVKFMFPNPHSIYLHDTPQKALFQNDLRAYSHGCIRLNEPFDFAYELLAPQSDDPEGLFGSYLKTGVEAGLRLDDPVPVHLVYFTAWPSARGQMTYRRDVYGRDAAIFRALTEAGVVLTGDQG